MLKVVATALLLAALTACGGGSSDPVPEPTALTSPDATLTTVAEDESSPDDEAGADVDAVVAAKMQYATLLTSFKPKVRQKTDPRSGLIHPGLGMTKTHLDTMQKRVRQGHEPWATAFDAFAKNARSTTSPRLYYQPTWTEILHGGPNETGHVITVRMAMDADVAFHQIVMWYVTGAEVYRLNAMRALRNYFSIVKVEPHWDSQIRWGVAAYKFCFVADLLKHSEGNTPLSRWTEADQASFANLMTMGKGLLAGTGYWMNQHGFATMGLIGTAVALDDRGLYDEAVERITVNARGQAGGRNGSIKWQMRYVDTDALTGQAVARPQVQVVEMARDQAHAWINPTVLSLLAQITYNQGTRVDPFSGVPSGAAHAVDLFSFLDHRLLAGADYITRYSEGENVTWIPVTTSEGNTPQIGTTIAGAPRSGTAGILYNHYRYVKRWDRTAPALRAVANAYEARMPEADGGTDFPGNGTLFYTPAAGRVR